MGFFSQTPDEEKREREERRGCSDESLKRATNEQLILIALSAIGSGGVCDDELLDEMQSRFPQCPPIC